MSSRNSTYRLCALIPTYNNAGTIVDVVRRTHDQLDDIIVVDDGCTDDTLARLQTLDFPVTVVSYPRNKGKGGALADMSEFDFPRVVVVDYDAYAESVVGK